jgi:hypothetical protein
VSPVKYELGFYIAEDAILHNHRSENLKSYITLLCLPLFPVHIMLPSMFQLFSSRGFLCAEGTLRALTPRAHGRSSALLWRSCGLSDAPHLV